jgi:hypothetical protein
MNPIYKWVFREMDGPIHKSRKSLKSRVFLALHKENFKFEGLCTSGKIHPFFLWGSSTFVSFLEFEVKLCQWMTLLSNTKKDQIWKSS